MAYGAGLRAMEVVALKVSDVEQFAGQRDVVGLHAARQQTVVADAVTA